jgi:hypothetical protein
MEREGPDDQTLILRWVVLAMNWSNGRSGLAGRIELSLSSLFKWPRLQVVVFRRTKPSPSHEVIVNGVKAGSWRGKDLEKGIALPLRDAGRLSITRLR